MPDLLEEAQAYERIGQDILKGLLDTAIKLDEEKAELRIKLEQAEEEIERLTGGNNGKSF